MQRATRHMSRTSHDYYILLHSFTGVLIHPIMRENNLYRIVRKQINNILKLERCNETDLLKESIAG